MMRRDSRVDSRGFTLLEVLIALAILGLVIGGAMQLSQQRVRTISHIEEKLAAAQVAANLRQEFALQGNPLEPVQSMGDATMGQWRFQWRREVHWENNDERYRIALAVLNDDETVASLTWYLAE